VYVPHDAILTITGAGSLLAVGGHDPDDTGGAGIGGAGPDVHWALPAGQITINGGIITAIGGVNTNTVKKGRGGAGIGGATLGGGGVINISGSATVVTAMGGGEGAGIGGGGGDADWVKKGGDSGNITITGGRIEASSGYGYSSSIYWLYGAAIGGGGGDAGFWYYTEGGDSNTITISAGVTGSLTKNFDAPYHIGPGGGSLNGGTKRGTITVDTGAFGGQTLILP
jgi:hypothetical protein